ncbi:dynein-1-beta heavy chain, flagellar inner arm I1 complex-like [Haliotis rubra]|uniref:dynein-1-beta heavy chain, flagellar inner arm I1 complex-like n=1 Tax=Haliotis rubra TaxID=36100 RepID=UPI001EE5C46B|nr:dynein-1-beta heavy chain, flagellar inner arm I1 complex-like [Haliotis rubra]
MAKAAYTVTKNDMTELKALSRPPRLVKELLTVTLLLLGYSEKQAANYKVCMLVMADPGKDGLLQQMKNMDASSIPPDTVAKARTMLQECSLEKVLKVSLAAGGLYKWVAMIIA